MVFQYNLLVYSWVKSIIKFLEQARQAWFYCIYLWVRASQLSVKCKWDFWFVWYLKYWIFSRIFWVLHRNIQNDLPHFALSPSVRTSHKDLWSKWRSFKLQQEYAFPRKRKTKLGTFNITLKLNSVVLLKQIKNCIPSHFILHMITLQKLSSCYVSLRRLEWLK